MANCDRLDLCKDLVTRLEAEAPHRPIRYPGQQALVACAETHQRRRRVDTMHFLNSSAQYVKYRGRRWPVARDADVVCCDS